MRCLTWNVWPGPCSSGYKFARLRNYATEASTCFAYPCTAADAGPYIDGRPRRPDRSWEW